ncbi:hypothetical protein [Mycolicibacterium insubricum]|uniref:hypothetical protein n=1 Tax=Mycolicibacterium insubricum TaxID=444597 RepID=UPI0039089ED8
MIRQTRALLDEYRSDHRGLLLAVAETTVFARPVRHGVAALAQCGVPGGGGLGVDVGQQREAAGRHGVAKFPGEMFADPGLHLGAKFFRHRIRPVDR